MTQTSETISRLIRDLSNKMSYCIINNDAPGLQTAFEELLSATITSTTDTLVFNVKAYGAIGDGVADDINPINAALAALVVAGGGTLYFPIGTYKISAAIDLSATVDRPIKIVGDGTTFLAATGSKINGSSITAGQIFKNVQTATTIQDLYLLSNNAAAANAVIDASNCAEFTMRNVIVEEGYVGLLLTNSTGPTTIEDCSFSGCAECGVSSSACIALTLRNVRALGTSVNGFCIDSPNDGITLINCSVLNATNGFYITGGVPVAMYNCGCGSLSGGGPTNGIVLEMFGSAIIVGGYFGCVTYDVQFVDASARAVLVGIRTATHDYSLISHIAQCVTLDNDALGTIGARLDDTQSITLKTGSAAKAKGTIIFTGASNIGETITIDGQVHTITDPAVVPTNPNEIRGGSNAQYASGRLHTYFTTLSTKYGVVQSAWNGTDRVTFEWRVPGVVGNTKTFSDTCANATCNGGGFLGGTTAGVDKSTTASLDAATGKISASVGGLYSKYASSDAGGILPTDGALDTAFGAPATVGTGFVGLYKNTNAGDGKTYIVTTDGTGWFYATANLAV